MINSKGKKRLVFGIFAAGVIIILFAYRFWSLNTEEDVAGIASIQKREGMPVEVVISQRGSIEVWNVLTGTVEGVVQYPVISTNTLEVAEVLKSEGDWVEAGELVIRLDKDAPNPMLHSYYRSKAVYDNALREAERMLDLYREGAVSKQDLDKGQMALKVAKSDLENAAGSVGLTTLHSGFVTSIDVKEGDMAVSGKVLARVARTDSVRVLFLAGSRQAVLLQRGQKAVWASPYGKSRIEGEITKLDLSADPQTHLVGGEAVFANPERRLIPGLLVSFKVQTVSKGNIIKIPAECLIGTDNEYSVFVVKRNGSDITRARIRRVEMGVLTADEVEIISGIAEGDSVVRFGHTRIDDGDLVKVVRTREDR
jgi:membrane fusion protein (multidrug efflux system)